MSEIEIFTYSNGHNVRTVVKDDEPWFITSDVTAFFGYSNSSGGRVAVSRLPDRMRGVTEVNTPGGLQTVNIINEAGVYRLAMRSNLPAAEAFQDWIAEEVVPAIRRTGRYLPVAELTRADLARMVIEEETERKRVELERDAAEARLDTAQPKADYVDTFVEGAGDATLFRTFANQLKVGEQQLRLFLIGKKIIYKTTHGRQSSKGRQVTEYSYHAFASYKSWFTEYDQPQAPRRHDKQLRTTLAVTPVGKVRVAELWRKSNVA